MSSRTSVESAISDLQKKMKLCENSKELLNMAKSVNFLATANSALVDAELCEKQMNIHFDMRNTIPGEIPITGTGGMGSSN